MYQSEQSSHSVTVLKKKFDDIKRSIQNIEQKQKEFFTTSHSLDHSFLNDRSKPPIVPASDSVPASPLNLPRREYDRDSSKDSPSLIQRLERENSELANQLLDLSTQNKQLSRENAECRERIGALEAEVKELRRAQRTEYARGAQQAAEASFSMTAPRSDSVYSGSAARTEAAYAGTGARTDGAYAAVAPKTDMGYTAGPRTDVGYAPVGQRGDGGYTAAGQRGDVVYPMPGQRTTEVYNLPRSNELYATMPRSGDSYSMATVPRGSEAFSMTTVPRSTDTVISYSPVQPPRSADSYSSVPRPTYQRPQTAGPELRTHYTPRDYTMEGEQNPLFTQTATSLSSKSRPSSIIRNAKSPPKHNRVAFKTDVEVTHIDKEEPAASRSQSYFYQSRDDEPPRYASAPYLRRPDEDLMTQSTLYRREDDYKAGNYYRREDTPRDYSRWTNYYKRASFE